MLNLPEEVQEVNLRRVFSDSVANPVKKTEQRERLNKIVKIAIL